MQNELPQEIQNINGPVQAQYWFATYNNPPTLWKEAIEKISPDGGIAQLEKGANGTTHIQALLYFKKKRTSTAFRGLPIWTKAIRSKDSLRVARYCSKEDTRIEGPHKWGDIKLTGSTGSKVDYAQVLQTLKDGRFEDIDAGVQIRHFGNLQKMSAYYSQPYTHNDVRGVWVYGSPGVGKSHWARENYPNPYLKSQNKWFDNYRKEPYILLDDFDKLGSCLSHLLKIWLDKWSHQAEIKGSSCNPQHTAFVITSNYLPSDIWPDDNVLVSAITRRCYFVVFHSKARFIKGRTSGEIPNLECSTYCACKI